ncbi:hypothetical protein F441_10952 [Phytophthora nicotianae CJ01A1]|uniref:Uncharacterized protein n=1 Tax=Phytophthora nicotianae CJ01A1 TaxID=1317063 RepID=W2WWV4_PHYNI|nr:hypothetical protein F441_10952 [Phytophthora nicotianae CJ01A1]
MKLAAESKANVEKQRLEFDKEKWSTQEALERDRLAFEKSKWEKEREDRRSELNEEKRFHVLSSLIEKGRSAEEAEAFLNLL